MNLMANWIKMLETLPDNPKVLRIANRVGVDRFSAAARCLTLWAWAQHYTTDGRIDGVSARDIDEHAKRKGFAAAMAMKGVEWLTVDADGVRFMHWERHNGSGAKSRAQAAQRQDLHRGKSHAPCHGERVTDVTEASRSGHAERHGEGVTRLDKRRINHPSIHGSQKNSCALPVSDEGKDAAKCGEISLSAMDGWMAQEGLGAGKDGKNLLTAEGRRSLLRRMGVRGENLERLAESGLTVEQVREELATIDGDPRVRNRVAVLTRRLLAAVGIPKKPGLTAETQATVARLEELRRRKGATP